VAVERWLADLLHVTSEAVVLGLLFVIALVAVPAVMLTGAAALTRRVAGNAATLGSAALRYATTLIPLGFGVWLAHYGFHLLTGMLTVVPVTQSAAIDLLGWAALGEPAWSWVWMRSGSVQPIQLGFVLLGACGSIGLVRAVSLRDYPSRPGLASAPWVATIVVLTAAALWILNQPMEMRGLGGIG
jgi:hypothetical protein